MTTKTTTKGFTLSKDVINDMLGEINNAIPFNKNSVKITQKVIDECEDNRIPQELLGYNVTRDEEGDHRTDGQFVDYTFTFISPKNKKTVIDTEMCLMVGWNYHRDVTFE